MVGKATALNAGGRNVYFACASYTSDKYVDNTGTLRQRTAENAQWAKSFWLDIDCGEDKVSGGKGYTDQEEAQEALTAFCKLHRLPMPMIVSSGGGLHCYWPLTTDIQKEDWLLAARQLKLLTQCSLNPLLADQTRTADIASILRPIGTQNWKPALGGADVKLLAKSTPVEFHDFRDAVAAACGRLRPSQGVKPKLSLDTVYDPLPVDELRGALSHINPDIEYGEWWRVLAAVSDTYGEDGRLHARDWSAGNLHGYEAAKFDPADFEKQYSDLLNRRDRQGPCVTLGSVIRMAVDGGWNRQTPCTEHPWLDDINNRYAWVEKEAAIYRLEHRDFIDPARFRTQFDNQTIEVPTSKSRKQVGKGTQWIKAPGRRQHKRLVLKPDSPEVTTDNCLNVWAGYAVKPIKGDAQPFMTLLERLVPDHKARLYILQWFAHLIQNPAVKMNTALVLWSHQQGVGKNLLVECIKDMIGQPHATLIGQEELARDFNGWLKDKILVIGDEVSSQDRRQHSDKLKGLITSTKVQINEKYQPAYETENLVNFIFLSNHNTALFVDDHDRRYFVWEIEAGRLSDADATAFCRWRDNGGLGHLRHTLEQVKLNGYNPKAAAPDTSAKRTMVSDNRSDLENWSADLMASPASAVLGREIATAPELAQRYAGDTGHKPPSARAVVAACKARGARSRDNQIRLSNGKRLRAMALERPDYWASQPDSAWAIELEKPDPQWSRSVVSRVA